VVQLVNQHSQRINSLEIDKITTEEVRKANVSFITAAKINPALAKEISAQSVNKTDSYTDTVDSFASNLSQHSSSKNIFI
jgi:hypothetical protein